MNKWKPVLKAVPCLLSALAVLPTLAAEKKTSAPAPKVKYKSQSVDFEAALVQGQIRRPEISVITGNQQQGTDGLLRLRNDFADRLANDAGEEL